MRRLLLSTAKAPERDKKTKSLIAIRAQQLSAMGDHAAVVELIKVSPTRGKDEALMRSEADVLFLSNDNARVCPLVAGQIQNADSAYWQKAFIFCQSLAGEHEKASLGASMLREQGEEDEVFFGLVDTLAGLEKFDIKSLINPKPLHFAMVRAAKAKLPTDVSSSNNPAILRTIATSPNAHPELRLDAAERAENMGALRTDILRQLYAGVTFSEEALANPLTTADAKRGPLSRALLYRKALVESIPTAMAEVLSQALQQARETARYQSMSRVYQEILKGLEPTQDLVWFAPEAVRALLAAGDLQAADNWFKVLRSSALFNEDAVASRNRLSPLARIAGAIDDEDWRPELLTGWWLDQITPKVKKDTAEANEKAAKKPLAKAQLLERARPRALLLYNILEALGDDVPDANWVALLTSPPQTTTLMPQPALWRSLTAAADRDRIGEVVLFSMLALGQGGPAQADPTVLRKVLTSLNAVGLAAEARALALEAAVASGI